MKIKIIVAVLLFSSAQFAFLSGTSAAPADGAALWAELTAIEDSQGTEAANQAFYRLSPKEQAAVEGFITGETYITGKSEIASQESDLAAASSCWGWTRTFTGRAATTGDLFFKYHQQITWCGNGSTFWSVGCSAWPSSMG